MKSDELNGLLRHVAMKTFVDGIPNLTTVVDEGMLFGAYTSVPTNNKKWKLYMEMKFQLLGGEDESIENPAVLEALGIQETGIIQ